MAGVDSGSLGLGQASGGEDLLDERDPERTIDTVLAHAGNSRDLADRQPGAGVRGSSRAAAARAGR